MIFRRNLLMNRKTLGLVDSDDTNGRLSQFFFRKIYSSPDFQAIIHVIFQILQIYPVP